VTTATATIDLAGQHRRGRIYVALAAVAWSTAGLFQRELSAGIGTQLAGRAAFAVVGVLVAGLMAVSSGAFIVALNYTTVANVLFMQALAPVLAAVLGTFVGEPVARRTWVAMTVAVLGVGLMVGGPDHPSVAGVSISLLMSVSFAAVIVITRHRRDVSMAPATCLSQLLVLLFAAPFADPGEIGGRDLLLLAALGIGQIGLGLIFLSLGARLIPAAEVALITLLEIVLGPLWVWIALSERPGAATLTGGAIVLAAVLIQVRGAPAEPALPAP
jgi:drug/metabolite transporter (DMT)-like permease